MEGFRMVARDKDGVEIARKPGRPTTLTAGKAEELVRAVRQIGFADPAARLCGVPPTTLDGWMKRGEDAGNEPFASFRVAFLEAQAQWEAEQLAEVKDPRWMLERQNPRVYGKPEAGVSVNVSQTQVAVDHAALREAQLEVLRALERDPQYLDGLEDGEEE